MNIPRFSYHIEHMIITFLLFVLFVAMEYYLQFNSVFIAPAMFYVGREYTQWEIGKQFPIAKFSSFDIKGLSYPLGLMLLFQFIYWVI